MGHQISFRTDEITQRKSYLKIVVFIFCNLLEYCFSYKLFIGLVLKQILHIVSLM